MRDEPTDNANHLLERATAALHDLQTPPLPPAVLARIAAGLEAAGAATPSAKPKRRFPTLHVSRRTAAGLLLAGALLGTLLWSITGRGGNTAFADMLRNVRAMQSLSFRVTRQVAVTNQGGQTITAEAVTDGAGRVRQTLPGLVTSVWDLEQHKALVLVPEKKQAVLLELNNLPAEPISSSLIDLLGQFRKMDEHSARPVGEKKINGRTARGFAVSRGEQEMTVWVDLTSRLPAAVEIRSRKGATGSPEIVISDFVWDSPVEGSLMGLIPPKDYELLTMPVDMSLPTELELIAALADPPRVIKASPDHGQTGVDPGMRQIRIVFDQPMEHSGYLVSNDATTFPRLVGQGRWVDDRTFEVDCQLEPDHDYWLSVNSEQLKSFRNKKGEPAAAYPIGFRTGSKNNATLSSVEADPPHVIQASPDNGQEDVDPGLRQIRIAFDQPMLTGDNYSIVGGGPSFPKLKGEPRWLDERTLVLDCELEADREYYLSINSERFNHFRNRQGESAVPYPITFTTAPTPGSAMRISNPQVVQASPDNGQRDVEPDTRELRIVFDQPMEPLDYSIVGGGESYPHFVGKPRWEDDHTFVYEWRLEPDHEYWLSINNEKFKHFHSKTGRSAVPYPISFTTAPAPGAATRAANPRVVQVSPDDGQTIDPGTRELRIVFDQPMRQGSR